MEELKRLTTSEFHRADKTPVVVLLDNIRSQHNIGSIFRTCDAFLIEKLILCGITSRPPNNEINKTALGATESVNWEYFDTTLNALKKMKEEGYYIIAAEQTENSTQLLDFKLMRDKKYALIFGHEMKGVDQFVLDECDACIEIPQFGTKHSLNVAVSAGILLWHFFRELKY